MFKPMKCASIMEPDGTMRLDKIVYPKYVSRKFDGNRCYVKDGIALSSSGKPIRNDYIRECLSQDRFNGFDGEIIIGQSNAPDVRRKTSSGVARKDGTSFFLFHVFDNFLIDAPFQERMKSYERIESPYLLTVNQILIKDEETMLALETMHLHGGYEGIVLKDPNSPYKMGRSTLKENYMIKLKRLTTTVPPLRGPNPQGLNIGYNTVTTIKSEKITNGRNRQTNSNNK